MKSNKRGQLIRNQILRDVRSHPTDISSHIGNIFSISRQAVNKHLKKLVDEGYLEGSGSTRNRTYKLGAIRRNLYTFPIKKTTSEHSIYSENFMWVIEGIPKNIEDIVFYGFTEIVNNAIDHSQGSSCSIFVIRNKNNIRILVTDNGEGIFKRITRIKNLIDEKQALLELHKGKLTTDPDNHSGQGIFFTSKMFDYFQIKSFGLEFQHIHDEEADLLTDIDNSDIGTEVYMQISLDSQRTDSKIFDKFSGDAEQDYAFNRTIIPVELAKFGNENLVSRSQAKRLLARIENFLYVVFDFSNVETIGQAFADEIFRVYPIRYPNIEISYINSNKNIDKMINRTKSG